MLEIKGKLIRTELLDISKFWPTQTLLYVLYMTRTEKFVHYNIEYTTQTSHKATCSTYLLKSAQLLNDALTLTTMMLNKWPTKLENHFFKNKVQY